MTSSTKEVSKPLVYEVEHFKQRFNWDCGISCIMMLLPQDQRDSFLGDFTQICEEEGFGHSTWTIDLCYLLKRFNIKHHMYTTMLGVNEAYKKQGYYSKIIDLDRDRVEQRFEQASTNKIPITVQSTSMESVVSHLRVHGPVILLVDAGLLLCDLCKHNKLKADFRRCFGGGYKGHYILAVGCSSSKVLYRDPALPARLCAASYLTLHRARAATGTDHDSIFVYLKR